MIGIQDIPVGTLYNIEFPNTLLLTWSQNSCQSNWPIFDDAVDKYMASSTLNSAANTFIWIFD